jgi:hypothetical protein
MRPDVELLRSRGFAICKPDPGTKNPISVGWSTRSLEAKDFKDGDLVGILGGPLSDCNRPGHALVIADIDDEEALLLAGEYLPATGMIEGRRSKPQAHRGFLIPFDSIPWWAVSEADQGSKAAKELKGHPGPFLKHFKHRETKKNILDFIGTGGQVVCPPSKHPSGEIREWEGGSPGEPAVVEFITLWEAVCELAWKCGCDIPPISKDYDAEVFVPEELDELAAKCSSIDTGLDSITRAKHYLSKIPGAITSHGGHDTTFWAARAIVYGFDLGQDVGFKLLWEQFNPRCKPRWGEAELRHKVKDADTKPFRHPRGYLLGDQVNSYFADTDIANGRRFVKDHGGTVRFVADWNRWLVFDGKRWAVDRSETLIQRLAKETTDRMAFEAGEKLVKAI